MTCEIDCKRCRFYCTDLQMKYPTGKNTGSDIHTFCVCQNNIDRRFMKDDPRKFISTPSIINRLKNCNWFELKDTEKTYVWSAKEKPKYKDNGPGTFNVNPTNGIEGFYIGNKNLKDIIAEESTSIDVKDLKKKIDEVSVRVDGHDSQINDLEQAVVDISDAIDDIEENEKQLNSRVTQIAKSVEDITIDEQTILNGGTSIKVK